MSAQLRDRDEIRSLTLQGAGQVVGHPESSPRQATLSCKHSSPFAMYPVNAFIENLCVRRREAVLREKQILCPDKC